MRESPFETLQRFIDIYVGHGGDREIAEKALRALSEIRYSSEVEIPPDNYINYDTKAVFKVTLRACGYVLDNTREVWPELARSEKNREFIIEQMKRDLVYELIKKAKVIDE